MKLPEDRMKLKVVAREELTKDICEFTLQSEDGGDLPPFTPGAHITVQTPDGAMRRYSLLNDGEAPEEYVIAVKREADMQTTRRGHGQTRRAHAGHAEIARARGARRTRRARGARRTACRPSRRGTSAGST